MIRRSRRRFTSLTHCGSYRAEATTGQLIHTARKLVATIIVAALWVEPLSGTAVAQAPIPEATRARVRALQASGDRIEITLVDRTILRGRIIETANDSFTIGEEKTNREVALQYGQVMEVKKWEVTGLSDSARAAIVLGVVGAVLLVFCAAPFPLGFLCKQDPS